jgi:alkylation response protein AidB-like acyl-CoA dehydrogenase
MAIGTDEQKRDIIGPLLRNEVIWCQGFSEPGAGSDLAALSTRAELDGDHWVVNGQKVWTTNALHADKMFALVRTSQESKKHQGISMLLIDMHAEGVDARPLKQMTGNEEFGEVFLTDVRVPVDQVLGEVGAGWNVAMLLLSFERGSSAIGQYTHFKQQLEDVIAAAKGNGRAKDPVIRQRIAQIASELGLLRLHSWHILTQVEQGRELGFEASMTKLQWSEAHQDLGELYMDVLGYAGQVVPGTPTQDLDPLQEMFLWSRSETIWGGSSQVQRNIVAERVLGLPR